MFEFEPQTKALMDELTSRPQAKMWEVPPEQMRAQFHELFAEYGLAPADLADHEDLAIPGPAGPIRSRIYRPRDAGPGPLPGLVYFHGGGMNSNSIDTYDALIQHLCAGSGCVTVACDYRLAPEHPFPAGVDDSYAVASWMHANCDRLGIAPDRLAIGGDSAGGYLTAVLTQMARDQGGPPFAFQLLIYPAVGTRGVSRSLADYATGCLFEREELDWIYRWYVTDPQQLRDPRVCPILQADFSDLPPAFVITAEYDILRDDAEHYVRLLEEAGVPVELHRYSGTVHPFLNLAGRLDLGRQAIAECARKLRQGVSRTPGG